MKSQVLFVFRGSCDFGTKARLAVEAGAVALVIINHDQTRPDHAFAASMARSKQEAELNEEDFRIPCVMVSWNSGQAILEDNPERLRLYPGGGRPFIESVSDESPSVFLIHNMLTDEECEFIRSSSRPLLRLVPEDAFHSRAFLHRGIWKTAVHSAIDERLFSIVNYPSEHFSDLEVCVLLLFLSRHFN